MAKLAVFALLVLALVAMASATRYSTIITTSEIDEEHDPMTTMSCDKELQSKKLTQCGLYMMQRMSIAGGIFFPLKGPLLNKCCSELTDVSWPCRCEALKKMTMGLPTLPSMIGKSEEIWQVAQNLPQTCKMPYSPSCSSY